MSLEDPSGSRAFASARSSAWAELCGNDEEDDSVETVNASYGSLLGKRKDKPKKKPVLMLDAKEAAKAFEVMEINAGQLMTNPQKSARVTDFQPVDPLGMDDEDETLGFASEEAEAAHDDWDESEPANGSPADWIAAGWDDDPAAEAPAWDAADEAEEAILPEWQAEEAAAPRPIDAEPEFTQLPEPVAHEEDDQPEATEDDWDDEPGYSFADGWSKSAAIPRAPEPESEPEPVYEPELDDWEEAPALAAATEPPQWAGPVEETYEPELEAEPEFETAYLPETEFEPEMPDAPYAPEATLSAYVPGQEDLGEEAEDEPTFESASLGESSSPRIKKMALAPPPDFEDSLLGLDDESFDAPLDQTGGFDPYAEASAFEELDPLAEPEGFVPIMPDPVKHPPMVEKPGHGLRAKVIGNVEPSTPLSHKLFALLVRLCRWAWKIGKAKWQEFQAARANKGDGD